MTRFNICFGPICLDFFSDVAGTYSKQSDADLPSPAQESFSSGMEDSIIAVLQISARQNAPHNSFDLRFSILLSTVACKPACFAFKGQQGSVGTECLCMYQALINTPDTG